ncbi:hypothetical protein C8R45DRAFT_1029603 [Mycena sanguinolenta]|nr:hypothetical protein C8R45DRAFT_1029603 [Mycena sanguinolenta]
MPNDSGNSISNGSDNCNGCDTNENDNTIIKTVNKQRIDAVHNNTNGDGGTNSGQIIINGGQTSCMSMLQQPAFIVLLFLVVLFAILFVTALILLVRERHLRKRTAEATTSDGDMQENLVSQAEPIAVFGARMQPTGVDLDEDQVRRLSAERAQSPWSIRSPTESPPGYV